MVESGCVYCFRVISKISQATGLRGSIQFLLTISLINDKLGEGIVQVSRSRLSDKDTEADFQIRLTDRNKVYTPSISACFFPSGLFLLKSFYFPLFSGFPFLV